MNRGRIFIKINLDQVGFQKNNYYIIKKSWAKSCDATDGHRHETESYFLINCNINQIKYTLFT